MPIPRTPPDKPVSKTTTDLVPENSEREEIIDPTNRKETAKELVATATTRLKESIVGELQDDANTTIPPVSEPPEPPDNFDNVTVDSDTVHTFNDTEVILRLTDDLDAVRPIHRLHYDMMAQQNHHTHEPKRPQHSSSKPHFKLTKALQQLMASHNELHDPIFRFKATQEAAEHNLKILRDENFDLGKICNKGKRTILRFGSEFKETRDLQKIFQHHPRWHRLEKVLTMGVDFDLDDIDDELRWRDLAAAVARGNHKSAKLNNEFLSNALKKEIEQGWMLALPSDCIYEIPGLTLSPMGVATHIGITDTGDFLPKNRVTHDLSFPGAISGLSVNSRIDPSKLEPCMFSHVFSCIIHYIVALRSKYPRTRIWIRKEDFKSAFRRIHFNATTAYQSAVKVSIEGVELILISLRQPFGGAPCPSEFALLADLVTDTINDLLEDETWDYSRDYSMVAQKIPKPKPLSDNISFHKAREMSVSLQVGHRGKSDVYVDDVITIAADIKDNLERITRAPVTIMYAVADNAPVTNLVTKRKEIVAEDKMIAEGAAEELKICLGWLIDTRRLRVQLPIHKVIAWKQQINTILSKTTVSNKELQSILGRLENVAQVMTTLGHFLSNIRHIQLLAEKKGHNIKLNKRSRADLELAKGFINRVGQGVSMNLLTFRIPDIVYICDASEYGLGGFASHGRAWSFTIPPDLRNRAHINILEYMAQIISIWLDIIENTTKSEDCLLSIGDNTSALGWMRRSNFRQTDDTDVSWDVKQQLGRHLANLILDSETVLYKQWLRGQDNAVADSLSRDNYYLSNTSHERFLSLSVPQQLPPNFKIRPLPREIYCFITSMLQKLPGTQLQSSQPKPSDLARGNIGILTSIALDLATSTSTDSTYHKRTSSCQVLPKQSEQVPSLDQIMHSWWKEQSQPPLHMWHRPSGQTIGMTQDWTLMARHVLSSKSNLEDTRIKMVPKRNRKHCL